MICFFYLISHIKIIILFYNFAFITRSYIDILKTTPSIDKKQSFNITNFPVKFLTQQTTPRGKWTSCSKQNIVSILFKLVFWILRIGVIYFDFETTGMNHKLNFFKSSKKIINGIFILLDFLYKNDVVFHTSTMFYAFQKKL